MTAEKCRVELSVIASVLNGTSSGIAGEADKTSKAKMEDLLGYVRLLAKYAAFDLEATKRELDYYMTHRDGGN